MKNQLYNFLYFLNVCFHPVFIPMYLSVWFFFGKSTEAPMVYAYFIPFSLKLKWILLYTALTAFIPIIILFFARILKLIHSIHLDSVKDRKYIFLLLGVYYWFLFYMFRELYAREFFRPTIVLISVMSVVMFLFSLFTIPTFKPSIHAAGFGALSGFFVSIILLYHEYFMPELYFSILLGSLVMLLRMLVQAHTFAELVSGWALGLFSSVTVFLLTYKINT